MDDDLQNEDDAKENRRFSTMPTVPGAWDDGKDDEIVDEGVKRGGKRAKTEPRLEQKEEAVGKGVKKPNKAREAAARNAKGRKEGIPGQSKGTVVEDAKAKGKGKENVGGRGILSMARLNMLSRPKGR